MAQDAKQVRRPEARGPQAQSVDRKPSAEPTPEGHGLPVGPDDEPRGHPTSERFRTEQAHRKGKTQA